MDTQIIFDFISDLVANNNRDWFKQNRSRYDEAWQLFNEIVGQLIAEIGRFDSGVSYLTPKDCTYRIYRDVRFSQDKTPYKGHFAANINPAGKKAMYGGYYVQFDPTHCELGSGAWWLPSQELRSLKRSIVDQLDLFESIVDEPDFKSICPVIGLNHLTRIPNGFPKDFPRPEFLLCKDFTCYTSIPKEQLPSERLPQYLAQKMALMKPYNDFLKENIQINLEEMEGMKNVVKII